MRALLARFRRKSFAAGAALAVVLGVGIPVAGAALPAAAINCSYGDNFYYFANLDSNIVFDQNPSDNNIFEETTGITGQPGNNLAENFCQVIGSHSGYYEWVAKGTDQCLTYFTDQIVHMATCQMLDSQQWILYDFEGSGTGWADYGGFLNYLHVSSGANYAALDYYPFTLGSVMSLKEPWPGNSYLQYGWTIYGPFA